MQDARRVCKLRLHSSKSNRMFSSLLLFLPCLRLLFSMFKPTKAQPDDSRTHSCILWSRPHLPILGGHQASSVGTSQDKVFEPPARTIAFFIVALREVISLAMNPSFVTRLGL